MNNYNSIEMQFKVTDWKAWNEMQFLLKPKLHSIVIHCSQRQKPMVRLKTGFFKRSIERRREQSSRNVRCKLVLRKDETANAKACFIRLHRTTTEISMTFLRLPYERTMEVVNCITCQTCQNEIADGEWTSSQIREAWLEARSRILNVHNRCFEGVS